MYQDTTPDILIHLAAIVGGIGANQANPGRFFYENMAIGLNVVEEARRYGGLEKLVLMGTTCSYPKFSQVPFREESIWDGYPEETNAPYGVAKRALLAMAWGYREQHCMNIIYLTPTNLFGPGDNFDPETSHVIPALIRKFVEAKEKGGPEVVAWGTGNVSREFLYVEDAADAIILATERYGKPEPANLGTGREVLIRDLVHQIKRQTGYEGKITWDNSRKDGQPRRSLDTTRAQREFGFEASTSLEEGLKWTIDWYLRNRASG